jgi:NADH-quinone oxidoreductase subunit G
MDTVAQDPVLNVSERGDRALIGKFEGEDLTHPWAGNVIDLCPVGALLSKDALNKVRAWEVDRSPSVCPNCTQGCNMIVETRDNQVVRLRPRPNDEVNKYFMCDYGRLNYRWMNRRDPADVPLLRRGAALETVDWEVATRAAADLLAGKRTFVLASPMLSNEALFLLSRLIRKTGGTGAFRVERGDEAPLPGVEGLARRRERAANVRGAQLFGFQESERPLDGLTSGDVLVVADEELAGVDAGAASRAGAIIVVGTSLPGWAERSVAVVLPITNFTEQEGTFTNVDGRVQRFMQARAATGLARPSFWALGDLLAAMGEGTGFFTASDAFAALAGSAAAFAGMSYETLGVRGAVIAGADRQVTAGATA